MGGLEATRILRDEGYNGAIVALTANALSEDRDNCISAGCNDFLTKPINRKHFEQVLSQYLTPTDNRPSNHEPKRIVSSLLDQDPGLAELVQKYVEALPDLIAEIKHAYNKNDWEELRSLTHNLKSTGGNYGFNDISECASRLEFEILKNDNNNIEQLFARLDYLLIQICGDNPESLTQRQSS